MKENKYLNHLVITLTVLFSFLVVFVAVKIIDTTTEIQGRRTGDVIQVSGEGEVFSKPDLAVISFSVVNEESDADLALEKNAETTNQVINYFKESEINEDDIKTTTFNIRPRYEYYTDEMRGVEGRRVLAGYEVRQTVEIRLRDMEKIGEIVEGGVGAGANEVNNVVFTIENKKELEREAREKAIARAKEEASILGSQLGVRLGKIVDFSERFEGVDQISRSFTLEEGMMMSDSASPEIMTGENKVSSKVTIVYEIK